MLTVKASAAKADSPYAPIMAALLHLAGCDEMATLEEQRQGLAEYLRRRTALTVHQREALLGLVSAGDEAAGAVTPRPALETLFREWAGRPLVLVFEDWHWADSASRALLDGLAELAGRAPLLLVVTARRGADCPEWPRQVALDLDPLPPADTESLLARLGAPEKDRSELAALSGGVPLYAEELVRLGGGEAAASRSRTLQELIAARLDAVGPAKRTAQIGSIVGRGFTPRLVAWVDDREQAAVAREIDALEAADLVIRHRTSQGLYYQFKHTLIEEAVYASLPAEERRFLHGRLAAVVEREFPTQAATHPEGLADQYRRAGQPDRAAPLYLRAADRSAHLGAHAEALAHLDRAADQAGAMPHGEERTALERQVERSRVAQALFPDGWRDSLSQPVADEADFDGLLTRTFQELPQGRWTELMARSRRLLAMAHHSGDADQIRTARHLLGFCAFYAGEYAEAEQHFRDVLPEAAEDAPSWLVHLYHGPPKAVELVYRGLTALWRGHYQGTERFVARALELARGFGSPSLSGYVLVLAAAYYRHTFQPDQVLTLTAEALDLGRAERVRTARLGGLAYRQWARAALGQPTHLDRTVRILRAQGGSGAGVVAVVAVLPAYGRLGRWRDQLRLASGILHGTDRLQSSETHKSMLYTEIGRARLALGDWAEGEASLERSIAITRREGNRLRYIRAVLPLARHLRLKGEPDRAARLLREAIETLPADSGSPDLAAAQRLLDLTAAPAPAPSLNSLTAQP
jgi:tetratricopeptide (TPR) repeat protein